jgi:hypothetical protein
MTVARSSPSGPRAVRSLLGTNLVAHLDGSMSPIGRPRRFFDWDYFTSGGVVSGQIGRMGWSLVGVGSPSYTRVDSTFASAVKGVLSTSSTLLDRTSLVLGESATLGVMNPTESFITQGVWRMGGSVATKRVFFGWCSDFSADPILGAVDALGLAYDSSLSPNYLIVNHLSGGGDPPLDTGVVVPTATGELITIVQRSGVEFTFYIGSDGVLSPLVGSVVLPSLSGYVANFGFDVTTLDAAVSTLEVGYWGLTTTELSGLFSADSIAQGAIQP